MAVMQLPKLLLEISGACGPGGLTVKRAFRASLEERKENISRMSSAQVTPRSFHFILTNS